MWFISNQYLNILIDRLRDAAYSEKERQATQKYINENFYPHSLWRIPTRGDDKIVKPHSQEGERNMRVKLTNNFHGSEITLSVKLCNGEMLVSERQAKRARSKLCGTETCACGGIFGERPSLQAIPQGDGYVVYLAE